MENDPTIDLWCVFLEKIAGPALDAACRRRLAPDELDQERRFAHEESRRQFLVSRALLRTALARYTGCDPRALEFERNRYGKPSLTAPADPPLEFSLSHAQGLVVCAVTRRDPVGVDVECDRAISNPAEFARRFFTPAEAAALVRLPLERQSAELLRRWTLKEALAKVRGTGLGGLSQFSFDENGTVPFSVVHQVSGGQAFLPVPKRLETSDRQECLSSCGDWQCICMRLASRYHLALAVGRPASKKSPIRVWECGRHARKTREKQLENRP